MRTYRQYIYYTYDKNTTVYLLVIICAFKLFKLFKYNCCQIPRHVLHSPKRVPEPTCQNGTDISFITILVSKFSLYKIGVETILTINLLLARGYKSLINLTKNEDLNCDSKTMNHKYIG